jgi:hypothetical protein
MEAHRRRAPRRARGSRLVLEALEMRELPSVAPLLGTERPSPSPGAVVAEALAQAPGVALPGSSALNPATSSSPLIGTNPTPRELARERFEAYFSGPVYVSGGRFADQAKTLYFRGLGGSNTFLHGDYQMAIIFPVDPTQPLFGEAFLEDKNNNSGAQIGFQLQGTSPQTYDKAGRPTSFTFTGDPSINAGIFFSNTASGTVQIHYSKGSATAIFHGLVYTTGLTSPLANSDLYSRGGRITPRSGR